VVTPASTLTTGAAILGGNFPQFRISEQGGCALNLLCKLLLCSCLCCQLAVPAQAQEAGQGQAARHRHPPQDQPLHEGSIQHGTCPIILPLAVAVRRTATRLTLTASETDYLVIDALCAVAEQVGATAAAVALAWVGSRPGVETSAQFPGRHQHPFSAHVWLPGHHDRRADCARVTPAGGERKSLLSHTRAELPVAVGAVPRTLARLNWRRPLRKT
jgi:hypothetical protein